MVDNSIWEITMNKLILIILITFSYSVDLSWLKGNHNPNGKTGMLTFKPRHNMFLNDAVPFNNYTSSSQLTLSITDYLTLQSTQIHYYTTSDRKWHTFGDKVNTAYFHLPLYYLWE